jgi:hypothetical protein
VTNRTLRDEVAELRAIASAVELDGNEVGKRQIERVCDRLAALYTQSPESREASQLVERLRQYRPADEWGQGVQHTICDEAADEIELFQMDVAIFNGHRHELLKKFADAPSPVDLVMGASEAHRGVGDEPLDQYRIDGPVAQQSRDQLVPTASLSAGSDKVPEELLNRTFVVQHNPNCPSPFLVRLGGAGPIDMKPYGDGLGLRPHQTGDILGFGKTLAEAAEDALKAATRAALKKPYAASPAEISVVTPNGDLLHSAVSLMETIAESLPDDDVNAIMLSVMAGNIRSALAKLEDQP